ncbi:xanthine dehydrogenase family protein molybdopterin-binding subunit [Amaricoccus sp.]|uniref:xanthine dehydrogenase family protein molybdopterin-binding subunit n=1 Tax=Amaricoccus sp. TaxID=1872485 RepID=UPI001B7A541D|nr:xanthine dehydrogenase family protein molybdopterin-binding subunit [Amaricoccus sp.]MBP7240501.1 xanthine dehydrogenase family protein [Amaricoccus sp.]
MPKFGLSQSVRRKEDKRFLTGTGDYVDDHAPQRALHALFFRSPVGHGRIDGLDVSAARAVPGVVAVYTAADFAGKLDNGMDFGIVRNRDGSPAASPRRPILAEDVVRYAGEAIAVAVAETRAAALDAIDAILCDFEDLPAHVGTAVGGDTIHPEAPGNLAYDWAFGDEAATAAAFATAAHTTRLELVNNRVMGMSMEPRGAWAEWNGTRLHVAYSGQGVWMLKDELAKRFALPKADVRVTTPDVGGGFGIKTFNYPEYFAVAFAARELGRPVRWMSGRGEAMLTDNGGRDHVTVAEAAFDSDLKLTAVRVDCVANLGAYNSAFGQYIASDVALKVMPGVYDFQTAFVNVRGVYTNTAPVDAYRGAGRPESIYTIERLMDWSARQLGVDALELRRRSFIPRASFPYRTVVGELYDVGDFERVLGRAVAEADLAGFAARKAASAGAGRLRGLGLCYYIESILGEDREGAAIVFAEDGMVEIYAGTQSNGQGHETVFAQFLHQRAGIPFDRIRYVQGDSDRIARGGGTGGSRSVTLQGNAINQAADEVIARFRPLAEEELEVARADLVWEDGAFRVTGTDRSVDLIRLAEVARAKGLTGLLVTETKYKVPGRSYPNGAHFAEVEVDPETGAVRVDRYTVVDDFGFLVNPMLAEGQVHGGVAQGYGQAVAERVVYSPEGQLLSGSFMDYAMPRAGDLPNIAFSTELVPSTANETGMKGCGEAGTVGALAAVTNATLDALWEVGVRHVDMPLTPSRVWSWIDGARRAAE